MINKNMVYLKVKRQDSPKDKPYWENFKVEYTNSDTLLSILQKIGNDPKTLEGKEISPIHHEYNCKEEICGCCTVRVNGKPVMSCSTLIITLPNSSKEKPILVEPLEKFPVIRDLTVDRKKIFQALTNVKNWVETDDYFEKPLKYSKDEQIEMYSYSKCINCGSCYDACPRTDKSSKAYLGPAAISQVVKMCIHPRGKEDKKSRINTIMGDDGISKCGKALVCETVCPKSVPLINSIGRANREAIKKIFHLS